MRNHLLIAALLTFGLSAVRAEEPDSTGDAPAEESAPDAISAEPAPAPSARPARAPFSGQRRAAPRPQAQSSGEPNPEPSDSPAPAPEPEASPESAPSTFRPLSAPPTTSKATVPAHSNTSRSNGVLSPGTCPPLAGPWPGDPAFDHFDYMSTIAGKPIQKGRYLYPLGAHGMESPSCPTNWGGGLHGGPMAVPGLLSDDPHVVVLSALSAYNSGANPNDRYGAFSAILPDYIYDAISRARPAILALPDASGVVRAQIWAWDPVATVYPDRWQYFSAADKADWLRQQGTPYLGLSCKQKNLIHDLEFKIAKNPMFAYDFGKTIPEWVSEIDAMTGDPYMDSMWGPRPKTSIRAKSYTPPAAPKREDCP